MNALKSAGAAAAALPTSVGIALSHAPWPAIVAVETLGFAAYAYVAPLVLIHWERCAGIAEAERIAARHRTLRHHRVADPASYAPVIDHAAAPNS